MGIDPVTHEPIINTSKSSFNDLDLNSHQAVSSSRSISASAKLLNKVAAKLVPLGILDTLKAWQCGQSKSTEGDDNNRNNCSDNSASAQLLNNVASMPTKILLHHPSVNTCDINFGNSCNPESPMWPSGNNALETPRAVTDSSWILNEMVTKPVALLHCHEENWQVINSSVSIGDYTSGDGSISDIGKGSAYDILSNVTRIFWKNALAHHHPLNHSD